MLCKKYSLVLTISLFLGIKKTANSYVPLHPCPRWRCKIEFANHDPWYCANRVPPLSRPPSRRVPDLAYSRTPTTALLVISLPAGVPTALVPFLLVFWYPRCQRRKSAADIHRKGYVLICIFHLAKRTRPRFKTHSRDIWENLLHFIYMMTWENLFLSIFCTDRKKI